MGGGCVVGSGVKVGGGMWNVFRKGCEFCTCGVYKKVVHVSRKCDDTNVYMCGVSCVHVYMKGCIHVHTCV